MGDNNSPGGAARLSHKGAIRLHRHFTTQLFWQTWLYIIIYANMSNYRNVLYDDNDYNDNYTIINTNRILNYVFSFSKVNCLTSLSKQCNDIKDCRGV